MLQSSRSAKPAPRSTAAASTREALAFGRGWREATPDISPAIPALGAASPSDAASSGEAAALARALPSGSPPLVALGAASRSNAASRGEARAPAHRGPLAVLSSSPSLVALDIADRSAARSRGEAVLAEHNFVSSDLELPPEDRAMTMLRFIDLSGRHSSRGVRLATLLWITVPLVFITVIYCSFPLILGKLVEKGVEHYDRKVLGADIEIDRLSVALLSMRVELHGLKLLNPIGYTYQSPYILCADRLIVDLASWRTLRSRFKSIEVDCCTLDKVDFNVEYDGYILGGTSNVHRVLDFVKEMRKERVKRRNEAKHPEEGKSHDDAGNVVGKDDSSYAQDEAKTKAKRKRHFILKQTKLLDITARISNKTTGFDVAIADIAYNDFSREHGASMADDIIAVILQSLYKTLVANVLGRATADRLM